MYDDSTYSRVTGRAFELLSKKQDLGSVWLSHALEEDLPDTISKEDFVAHTVEAAKGDATFPQPSAEKVLEIKGFLSQQEDGNALKENAEKLYKATLAEWRFMHDAIEELVDELEANHSFNNAWDPSAHITQSYMQAMNHICSSQQISQSMDSMRASIDEAVKEEIGLHEQPNHPSNIQTKIDAALYEEQLKNPTPSYVHSQKIQKQLEARGLGAVEVSLTFRCFAEGFYDTTDPTISEKEREAGIKIIQSSPGLSDQLETALELADKEAELVDAFFEDTYYAGKEYQRLAANSQPNTQRAREELQAAYFRHGIADGEHSAKALAETYETTIRTVTEQTLGITTKSP